jgi:hypothetical protein
MILLLHVSRWVANLAHDKGFPVAQVYTRRNCTLAVFSDLHGVDLIGLSYAPKELVLLHNTEKYIFVYVYLKRKKPTPVGAGFGSVGAP